jgi:enoyl-CoA hydratase/carnithine racemase
MPERGVQHLARLLERGRAMEAILGADAFSAKRAPRYGWVNVALRVRGPARAASRSQRQR